MATLELLLASADDRRPALEGVDDALAEGAPKPKKAPRGAESGHWDAADRDPNLLNAQRWGVIAPNGDAGDRWIRAIDPLIRLREAEQGAPAKIFRVDPGMDAKASLAFKQKVLFAENMHEQERPRYLLVLGDLDEVSIELQHVLANGSFVGRLAFSRADDYSAYAEKVLASSRGPSVADADFVLHAANDGTPATAAGRAQLIVPAQSLNAKARSISVADDLLAARSSPAVLLSVSHGLGSPRGGWPSVEEQRKKQGALVLGGDAVLSGEELRGARFLPGGAWFCVACFGAGTPRESAFHAWLTGLSREGAFSGRVDSVLKSLPKEGDRPFVAAVPQAVLASPEGPLAMIGHVDLAWTHAFTSDGQSRASRVLGAIRVLLAGSRAGIALDALMRAYRETNEALMASYQAEEDARVRGERDPTDRKLRANLWMQRNDLRGYVLLGDPAARLAVGASASPRAVAEVPPAETAVEALLRGEESPRSIAARFGITLDELFAKFDAR